MAATPLLGLYMYVVALNGRGTVIVTVPMHSCDVLGWSRFLRHGCGAYILLHRHNTAADDCTVAPSHGRGVVKRVAVPSHDRFALTWSRLLCIAAAPIHGHGTVTYDHGAATIPQHRNMAAAASHHMAAVPLHGRSAVTWSRRPSHVGGAHYTVTVPVHGSGSIAWTVATPFHRHGAVVYQRCCYTEVAAAPYDIASQDQQVCSCSYCRQIKLFHKPERRCSTTNI